ncbi:MAG: beta-propeller domain-containing protein [Silvanigrellaceae bacterium]
MKNSLFLPSLMIVSLGLGGCGFGKTVSDYSPTAKTPTPSDPNYPNNLCAPLLKERSEPLSLTYNSCGEIESDLKDVQAFNSCVQDEWNKIWSARSKAKNGVQGSVAKASASADSATSSGASKGELLTNLREAGVDEADVVKVSADQIFVASSASAIQVIERSNKKVIGTLSLESLKTSSAVSNSLLSGNSYLYNSQKPLMFVTADRLIVLSGNSLRTYKTAAGQMPVFLQSKVLDGSISEARLVGERLVVASVNQQDWSADRRWGRKEINCRSVLRPVSKTDLESRSVTRLNSMSVRDLTDSVETSHPGHFSLYMTHQSIYLYGANHFSWNGWGEGASIRKISLDSSGRMGNAIRGRTKGRIKDVWALSELEGGELAVATSTGSIGDDSARNHFEVFAERDLRLDKIGETEDYGAKEDIRSVRFVGKMAYVVTFKKTDPLYAIDVSRPSEPRILGELKIPGFSTYMHPLSAERLIGLGFDATDQGDFAFYQGLQVSLFDTRDPMKMSRKDVRILGLRGTSSAATNDHKAFYMDQVEQVIAFPVTELNKCQDGYACQSTPSAAQQLALGRPLFSGAVFYTVSPDTLGDERRVTHTDLMSESCRNRIQPHAVWWSNSEPTPDIQRIFKLAGEIVTVSQGALKTFRMGAELEQTGSARWASDCD